MKISRRTALKQIGLLASTLWVSACSTSSDKSQPPPLPDSAGIAKQRKTIAMLGATGMAGGYILREALVQGYDLRVLARNPAKLAVLKDRIAIVQGDARDPAAIGELLHGSDVVISALGPVKSDGRASLDVCTVATGHIIRVMQEQDLRRYILLSGAAVTMPGDHRDLKGWLIQRLAQIALSAAVHDKVGEYLLLQACPLEWTLVRCPLIDAEPYLREARVTLDTPVSFHVRAGELARFVIGQIDSRQYVRQGPFIGSP